jgi:hypothetical protein
MGSNIDRRKKMSGYTSDRKCVGHEMSLSTDRLMTTGRDTSDRRCEFRPSHDDNIDTSDGRCEDHDMSLRSNHLMTTGGDTSDGRCENHVMSPSSDCPITTGEDTLEKV